MSVKKSKSKTSLKKSAAKAKKPETPRREKLLSLNFKTTKDLDVSKKLINQVIGQDRAVEVIKKASKQKRNVLLIGSPGTGKSLLAQAMAELLPVTGLEDLISNVNLMDNNNPKIKTVPAGQGRKIVREQTLSNTTQANNLQLLVFVIGFVVLSVISYLYYSLQWFSDVVYAAYLILAMFFLVGLSVGSRAMLKDKGEVPKVLVDNGDRAKPPYIDATGARAGALLGDVKHDPLQSGGLGTPAHLRVVPGAIHKAHRGVLYIDEISALSPKSQQELLTALQEKKYSITGQSEQSSGAQVQTEPVPCDFVLVASGNYDDLKAVHPALRSRIRGYGYEVYMNDVLEDTMEHRNSIAYFVAQEVRKDKKIPPFSKKAVEEVVLEAKRRAGRRDKLTVKLRDLGGLIRTAGDLAVEAGKPVVTEEEVINASKYSQSLERQMVDQALEFKKDYEVIKNKGQQVGRVNGLAVLGSSDAGVVLPVEAEVTPGGKINEIIATGGLGDIAKDAIKNVSALVKKYFGTSLKDKNDLYVQFLQTYGGVEGDSASITVATAVFSAFLKIPVRQDFAMTGSLSVRGEVLPVGGVNAKVLAAYQAGIYNVIIPKKNEHDLVLHDNVAKKVKIYTASHIKDVFELALVEGKKKDDALKTLSKRA